MSNKLVKNTEATVEAEATEETKVEEEVKDQETNQEEEEKPAKKPWRERHPKICGFLKAVPKKIAHGAKVVIEGILVIGGGIFLGIVALKAANPTVYGSYPLPLPEKKPELLPEPKDEVPFSDATAVVKEVETVMADPDVTITHF